MYNPGSISVSWNGFSHMFVRVSTSYASSVWSAFLKQILLTIQKAVYVYKRL